jgi:hypothetical protein
MRRWLPHDPGRSCLFHTITHYVTNQTNSQNAGALALTEAWNYYLSALEVHGRLHGPPLTAERIFVLDNRVTVWRGTSPLVVHEVVDGDPPKDSLVDRDR